MTLSALHSSFAALQNLARPGQFSSPAFLTEMRRYRDGLEGAGMPAGFLSTAVDLFSDPKARLDHSTAHAFLQSVERAGLSLRDGEGIDVFQSRHLTLQEMSKRVSNATGKMAPPVQRLFMSQQEMAAKLSDPAHAYDVVPTYEFGQSLSGVTSDDHAEVWQAFDRIEKRMVVVKTYPSYGLPGQGSWLNELRFQSNAPGDRIVSVYHAGRARTDYPYLALEWMEGGSIREWMTSPSMAPGFSFVASAMALARQMVEAVALTHQEGILHRDVRPANFFTTKDRQKVKLGEFGFAIRQEEFSLYPASTAEPVYSAPEASSENPWNDFTSDVYALGLSLYQLMTGLFPERIRLSPKTPLGLAAPHLNFPAVVSEVLLRAISPEPERRYPTAISMMEEIEETWPA